MNIKGEIGQIVYIPVTIREIKVDSFGINFCPMCGKSLKDIEGRTVRE